MELLPPPNERPWLLEQLAALIEAGGRARFTEVPLLEPEGGLLPSEFTPDPEGVAAVAAPLMVFAGLGELEVRLEALDAGIDTDRALLVKHDAEHRYEAAPVWFVAIEDGTCVMACELGALNSTEDLAGVMARVVAEAWREHAELYEGDPALEELLTDLSAVYLGMGLLTVEAARSSVNKVVAFGAAKRRPRPSALTAQATAFVLGAQLALRDVGPRERKRLLRQLSAERRDMVEAAVEELSRPGRLDDLRPSEAPAPERPMGQVVPLRVAGHGVQRVEGNQLLIGLGKGLVLGAILGFFSLRLLGPLSALLLFVVGGVAGANMGHNNKTGYCSGCGGELGEDDAVCSGCGGVVT